MNKSASARQFAQGEMSSILISSFNVLSWQLPLLQVVHLHNHPLLLAYNKGQNLCPFKHAVSEWPHRVALALDVLHLTAYVAPHNYCHHGFVSHLRYIVLQDASPLLEIVFLLKIIAHFDRKNNAVESTCKMLTFL